MPIVGEAVVDHCRSGTERNLWVQEAGNVVRGSRHSFVVRSGPLASKIGGEERHCVVHGDEGESNRPRDSSAVKTREKAERWVVEVRMRAASAGGHTPSVPCALTADSHTPAGAVRAGHTLALREGCVESMGENDHSAGCARWGCDRTAQNLPEPRILGVVCVSISTTLAMSARKTLERWTFYETLVARSGHWRGSQAGSFGRNSYMVAADLMERARGMVSRHSIS